MATITSNGTGGGMASVGASWVGGVAPVLADDVVIAAGDTIELDGAIQWNSMNCSGRLKASRVMSSSLTLFAELGYSVEAGGVFDFGTAADPIPAAYLAEWILDSPTAGGVKYKIRDGGEFTSYGAVARTRCTELTAQVLVGANVINVADATGWAVGDRMCFETTNNGQVSQSNAYTSTIQSISGLQITLVDVLPHQMEIGWLIGNAGANVIVRSNDLTETENSKNPCLWIYRSTSASDALFNAVNTSFRGLGKVRAYNFWGIQIIGSSWILANYGDFAKGCKFTGCSMVNMSAMRASYISCTFNNHLACVMGISTHAYSDHSIIAGNAIRIAGSDVSAFNYKTTLSGAQGALTNYRVVNSYAYASPGGPLTINGGVCRHCYHIRQGTNASLVNLSNVLLESLNYIINLSTSEGAVECRDCTFVNAPSVAYLAPGGGGQQAYDYVVRIVNKNGDPLQQLEYRSNGSLERDNTIFKSGAASQKLSPLASAKSLTKSWSVIAPSASPVAVTGFIRMDAAYNGNLPKFTLSGMGITPVVWQQAAGYAVDTWLQFSLAATHNAGADGVFDLLFECDGTAGSVWVDQIAAPPAVAVDTGAMGFYESGSAMPALLANFVTPADVRNEFDANSTQMKFMIDIESGKWEIIGSQMILYRSDKVTELLRFDMLNAAGQPEANMNKVTQRVPVL